MSSSTAVPGLRGDILLAGDPGYDEAIAGYNLAALPSPAAVVRAVDASDVAAAVRFAARDGLPVSVKATGHAPDPTDGALLIHTGDLDGVRVDPEARTVRVEAGVRWECVVAAAARHGLAALNGSSPNVGVVSYTLGGGVGLLGRAYGYAADHVRELRVVTADGAERVVDPDRHPDLFWALRGGKGAFGVVTSMVFDLFPLARLYGGALYFPVEQAGEVFNAYLEWLRTVPEELTSSIAVLRLPPYLALPEPLRGKLVVHIRVAYPGPDGERVVKPLREIATPLVDTVGDLPYERIHSIFHDPADPIPFLDNTALLHSATPATVDALLAAHQGTETVAMAELRHLGGAFTCPPKYPNAVSHRDAAFLYYGVSIARPRQFAQARAELDALRAGLAPWASGGIALNFTSDPADVRAAFDETTYTRLTEVKARWDPDNLFRGGLTAPPVP
ncbi:FAD/FMN-containing dehydrogenase [Crossiella equi]|uniref:FAD/FMN-containing dehydrogenase n=1 Tax=Crossiella equi TaxID=130796 RepID=A0ABS5AAM6_9PSEU|nr:FAD-binding protein [Crossiella equi]MBP2472780.1 FAD/FMN-containing dehydrogenase [Crossiella equi]